MAAVPFFPGVPHTKYRDRGGDSNRTFTSGHDLDTEWSASNFQAMTLRTDALIDVDLSPETVSYRHAGDQRCMKIPERRCSIDAPLPWHPDWNGTNNPLPYDLNKPHSGPQGSQWTCIDQDTSCSGGSTWSPRTCDSRSEADGYWSHQVSQSHDIPGVSIEYNHQQGSLCFPKDSSYHSSGCAILISPQDLQQYPYPDPEELMEDVNMKPELHEIASNDSYIPKKAGKYTCFDRPDRFGPKEEPLSPSPKVKSGATSIQDDDDSAMEDRPEVDDDDDDYHPKTERRGQVRRLSHKSTTLKNPPPTKQPQRIKSKTNQTAKPTKIAKKSPKSSAATLPSHKASHLLPCRHCSLSLASESALKKHVLASHTRPFVCTFHRYGCSSTVGSKNEWKRHINVQHMHLETWRCDVGACAPQSCGSKDRKNGSPLGSGAAPGSTYHEFDRKDLFTQHLKRMHAPPNSASRAEKQKFEGMIEAIQQRCYKKLRDPPAKSICPYCPNHPVFESWDERVEHVGRHLEKSDFDKNLEIEDGPLRDWLRQEGYLVWKGAGQGWQLKDTGKKRKNRGEKTAEEGEEDAEGEEEE